MILMQFTYDREERRDFWRRVLDFRRISVGWYLLIILIVPTLLAASILLDVLLGGSFPEMPNLSQIAAKPFLFPLLVLELLVRGALSEELGWRGFALHAAHKRWGALGSGLVIGLIWWAWHLPLFAWPSYGTVHSQWSWFTLMFWNFLITIILLSLLMTWAYLYNRESILTAILIHLFFNLTLGLVLPVRERVFLFFGILLALLIALVIRRRPISPIVDIPRPVGQLVE